MFDLYFGSDREKLQEEISKRTGKAKADVRIVRITDAHSAADFEAALSGPGLFSQKALTIFDGIISGENEELSTRLLSRLEEIAESKDEYLLVEGPLDASTRKLIEKHAGKSERFDRAKKEERSTIFGLANALRSGNKKALWIGYHRELQRGAAPEAVHGVLFWAAKEHFMQSRGMEREDAAALLAQLAELPHVARRRGFDLEYALEHFALSFAS